MQLYSGTIPSARGRRTPSAPGAGRLPQPGRVVARRRPERAFGSGAKRGQEGPRRRPGPRPAVMPGFEQGRAPPNRDRGCGVWHREKAGPGRTGGRDRHAAGGGREAGRDRRGGHSGIWPKSPRCRPDLVGRPQASASARVRLEHPEARIRTSGRRHCLRREARRRDRVDGQMSSHDTFGPSRRRRAPARPAAAPMQGPMPATSRGGAPDAPAVEAGEGRLPGQAVRRARRP